MSARFRGARTVTRTCVLGTALLGILAACERVVSPDGGTDGVTEQMETVTGTGAETGEQLAGHALARGLALALADESTRMELHRAMRESGFSEHKLELKRYLASREGAAVGRALMTAARMSPAQLAELLAKLPEMDLYVPFQAQRLAWRGTDDLAVGATLNVNGRRLTGFTPAGDTVEYDSRAGAPGRTLIILHPAEPKLTRAAGASRTRGATVEAAGEAPLEAVYGRGGLSFNMVNPPPGGGGGGAFIPKLVSFVTYIDDGFGASEVKFRHLTSGGAEVWSYRRDGVWPGYTNSVNVPTTMSGFVRVDELDSWFTLDDDWWGNGSFAPSGQVTHVIGKCFDIYRDGGWEATCNPYGTLPPAIAAEQPVLSVDVVYSY